MAASARGGFVEAGRILVLASALGIVYNAFSPRGIPLIRHELIPLAPGVSAEPPAIGITEARELFTQKKALFVDARSEEDFMLGHIHGAISLPLEVLEQHPELLSTIPQDSLIVTYCGGEDCASSTDLAYRLAALGYTNVRIFFAGWDVWLQRNLPVEVGQPQR